MSLYERPSRDGVAPGQTRRGLLRAIGLSLLAAPMVQGCADGSGFRPLYGPTASGAGLEQRLAEVDVLPIPGRVGQRIRNELIFQTTGGGSPLPAKYQLEVAIRESVTSTGVRPTGETLGQIYGLEAYFRLISIADRKVLFNGMSTTRASFERYDSGFANVRAREDAENRAARHVAAELKARVAAFLSSRT